MNKTAGLQTSKVPAGVCFSCSKFNIDVDFLNQIWCSIFLFFKFLLIFSSRGLGGLAAAVGERLRKEEALREKAEGNAVEAAWRATAEAQHRPPLGG